MTREFRPAIEAGLRRGLRVVPARPGPEFTRGPSVPADVRRTMRAAHAARRARLEADALRAAMARAKALAQAQASQPPPDKGA